MSRYRPHEDAVLAPYVERPVMSWDDVLARLPGRSRCSGSKRLQRLRRQAGTVWTIPQGGPIRLSDEVVSTVRAASGSYRQIARQLGLSHSYVRKVKLEGRA